MTEPKKTSTKAKTKTPAKEKPALKETSETPVAAEITAKAGKRSTKALKEVEEKQAKEERKADENQTAKPVKVVKAARPKVERKGKNFQKSAKLLEKDKTYNLNEAAGLAKKTSSVKFDATVELHVNLGVDPKHADQNIRDNVVLPSGSGKTIRIAVLTDNADEATKAGADLSGTDNLLTQIDKGVLDFDVLIATPALMSKLGKYARVLGPRGLMPNPKSGTVTNDVNKAISEAKSGRIEYRVDSTGIVHLGVGKVSFSEKQLTDNIEAVLASIKANKPQNVKGNYIKTIHLATTMGPSIPVDLSVVA